MATPTWCDVLTLTAAHARHLPEVTALAVVDHDPDCDATVAVARRTDLTDATAGAIIESATTAGRRRKRLLTALAGNSALPGRYQRHLATLVTSPQADLPDDERARLVDTLTSHVTDPTAIARLVHTATIGPMPKSPWETVGNTQRRADRSALEYGLLTMANRPELDDALVACDFLDRVHSRAHRELSVRGLLDDSILLDALHRHGLNHLTQYVAATVANPHPGVLNRFAHMADLPHEVADLIRARIVQGCARTLEGHKLRDVSDLIYRAWKNMPDQHREDVKAALRSADLTLEGRREWFAQLIRPPVSDEYLDAATWTTMPVPDVLSALDAQHWRVPRAVVDTLWARADVPTSLAIDLLKTANPIGFEHAAALRPWDREFAVALYARVPGFLYRVQDLDLIAQTLPVLLDQRPDCADFVVREGVLARIADRAATLPWPTQMLLAQHDDTLAAELANSVETALRTRAAKDVLPALFAPTQAPLTARSVSDIVTALSVAGQNSAA